MAWIFGSNQTLYYWIWSSLYKTEDFHTKIHGCMPVHADNNKSTQWVKKKKKYRAHEISWKNGETDMEVIGVTGVEGRFYKNTL